MIPTIKPETEQRPSILPNWIFQAPTPEILGSTTLADAGFASGAALALLHVALHDPITNTPTDLLRNRLALRTAINCLKIEGRMATEGDIRDAYYLTAPGDEMGPAGDMFAFWRAGYGLALRHTGWRVKLIELLPEEMRDDVSIQLDQALQIGGGPMVAAISIFEAVLKQFPRQEAVALFCADAVLAYGLGWDKPLPLFGLHLNRKILRAASEGEDAGIACHNAVTHAAQDAVRMGYDLARRAERLRAIAPKLRAKGSVEALNLFLSEDAVYAPTMLSPKVRGSNVPMTGRSARRLCDRLVELGVARELTGRKTFRLYGVA